MRTSGHHIFSRLFPGLLAATLLLSAVPSAVRAIQDLHVLLARISLELCEVGLAVLRVCGV